MMRIRPATSESESTARPRGARPGAARRRRPPRRRTAVFLAVPVLGLLLLRPGAARADTEDKAAAEALFEGALALVDAGEWAAGCPRFEQSYRLYRSRSTMIHIARCRAHEGKVASAWNDYQRALRVESPGQDAERQRELAAIAAREAGALEPRLPRLRVVITGLPAGARVQLDGQALPEDALGRPSPVDPGRHEITVSAHGQRQQARSVLLREGESVTVEMAFAPAAAPASTGGWLLPAGAALAVAGALGLGAGAATGVASLDLAAGVRERCGGVHCLSTDTASRQDVQTAKTLGDVSTASFIGAAALLAAGGTLLVLSLRPGPGGGAGGAPAAGVQAAFGPGQITLRGRF